MRALRTLLEEDIFLFKLCIFFTATALAQAVADSNFTGAVDVGIPWSANYSVTDSSERINLTTNLTQLLQCAFTNANLKTTITITDFRNLTGNVWTYFSLTVINTTVLRDRVLSALNELKNNTNCSVGNYILNSISLNETTSDTNSTSTLGYSAFTFSTIMSVRTTSTVQNNSTVPPSSPYTTIAVQVSTANLSLIVSTSSQLASSPSVTHFPSEMQTSFVTVATTTIIPSFSGVSSSFETMIFVSSALSLSSTPSLSTALSSSSASSALTVALISSSSVHASEIMQTSQKETPVPSLSTIAYSSSAIPSTLLPMSLATSSSTDNIKPTASTYTLSPISSSFFTASLSPIISVNNTILYTYTLSPKMKSPSLSEVLPSTVLTFSTLPTFFASSITPLESSVLATASMSSLASSISLSILPTSNIATSHLPTSSVLMITDTSTTIVLTPLFQTVPIVQLSTLTSVSYVHESISPQSSTDRTPITAMSPVLSTALSASSFALNSSLNSLIMSEMTNAFVSTLSAVAPSILYSSFEVISISPMVNSSLLTSSTIVPTSPTLLSPVVTLSVDVDVHVTPMITSSLLTTTTMTSLSHTLTYSISTLSSLTSSAISPVISSSFSESSVSLNTSSAMSSFSMMTLPISFNYSTAYEMPSVSLAKSSIITSSMTSSSIGTFSTTAVPSISLHVNQSDSTLSFSQAFSAVSISSSLFSPIVSVVTSSIVSTSLHSTSDIGKSFTIASLSNVPTASLINISIEQTSDSKSSIISTSYLVSSSILEISSLTHTPSLILLTSSLTSSVIKSSLYHDSSLFLHTHVSISPVVATETMPASVSMSFRSTSHYSELPSVDAPSAVISLLGVSSSTIVDVSINSFVTPSSVFSSDIVTTTIYPSVVSSLGTEVTLPSASTLSSFAPSSQHVTSLNVSMSSATTLENWYSSSIMTTPVAMPTSSINSLLMSSSVIITSVLQTNFPNASTIASQYLFSTTIIPTASGSMQSSSLIFPSPATSYMNSTSIVSSNVISSTPTSVAQTNLFPSTTQSSSIFISLIHTSSFIMTASNSTLVSLVKTTSAPTSYASLLFDIVSTFPSTTSTSTASVVQTFSNLSASVAPTSSNILTSTNLSSNWISIIPTSTISMTSAAVNTTIVPTMSLSNSSISSSQIGYTSTLILLPSTTSTMTIVPDVQTIISTEMTINHTFVPATSIPTSTITMSSQLPILDTSLLGYTSTLNPLATTTTNTTPSSTLSSSEKTFMYTFVSTIESSIQTLMITTTSISTLSNVSLETTTTSLSSSFATQISDITTSTGLAFASSLQSPSLSSMEISMTIVPTPSVNSSVLTNTYFITSSEQTSVAATSIEPTSSLKIQPTDTLSSTVTVTYSTSPTSESVTSNSPASTSTTAAPPTIQVKLTFSINETWNSNLANASSQEYVSLKTEVEKELTAAWQRSSLKGNFNRVVSITFSQGSVKIDSVLEFNEGQGQTIAADVVKKSFIDAVNSTQLGNFMIINDTVTAEIVSTKTAPQPTSTTQLPNWGIAVIVCGGSVLIFLLTLICVLCRRRHVTHKYALTEDPDDIGYRRSWATNGVECNPYMYDNKLAMNDEDLAEQVEIKNAAEVVTPYIEDTNERRYTKSALPDSFIDASSHYLDWPSINGTVARDHYDNTRTFYDQETDTWETPM